MLEAKTSTSQTGFFGVYPQAKKFAAKISVKRKGIHRVLRHGGGGCQGVRQEAFELNGINATLNYPEDYAAKTVTTGEISTEEAEPLGELVLN